MSGGEEAIPATRLRAIRPRLVPSSEPTGDERLCGMDSYETQEIVDAIDRLRSAIESLEMRVASLEGSVSNGSGGQGGGIERRLDRIGRTVDAIRKEMF